MAIGLRDYLVRRDKFEAQDADAGLAFPCCACRHRHGRDDQEPCRTCDHNARAVEEAVTPLAQVLERAKRVDW